MALDPGFDVDKRHSYLVNLHRKYNTTVWHYSSESSDMNPPDANDRLDPCLDRTDRLEFSLDRTDRFEELLAMRFLRELLRLPIPAPAAPPVKAPRREGFESVAKSPGRVFVLELLVALSFFRDD